MIIQGEGYRGHSGIDNNGKGRKTTSIAVKKKRRKGSSIEFSKLFQTKR